MITSAKKIIISIICITQFANAQSVKRVLFVGNSYVYTNNLPLMVSNLASAHGDSIFFDSSAPGAYTFQQHCSYATTLSKIAQGTWDYVVLQEQSQLPSFPPSQVATDCLPYAHTLDSLIHAADSCVETVFYMTWGRKNGDSANCASYPPLCTYAGMQGRLRDSYLLMGQQNNSSVAPVGCAWREVRNQNPVFDLYVADESHPTVYGSYVAACIFYSTFFKKPVSSLSYTGGISVADAALIQQQCNLIMFDSLQTWFANGNIPFASFTYQQNLTTYQFNNTSLNGISYLWDFGNGNTSTLANPQNVYLVNGVYPVQLTAYNGCDFSTAFDTLIVTTVSDNEISSPETLHLSYKNDLLKIITTVTNKSFRLKLFTADGKLIMQKKLKDQIKVHLKDGVYMVSVSADDGNLFSGKMLVGSKEDEMITLKLK